MGAGIVTDPSVDSQSQYCVCLSLMMQWTEVFCNDERITWAVPKSSAS